MILKKTYLLVLITLVSFSAHAQRGWEGSYNRLGIQAGVNHFNIITDDFDVTAKTSWTAGFTTRSSFYNDFQFVYGISFYDFNVDIAGREKIELSSNSKAIPFNMIGVQGYFFGSYKLFGHHLSLEAGPVLQVNGRLEPRQDRELYYVGSYDIQGVDMKKVSPFNVNAAIGASGGFETLKFWLVYQYGINNMLGKLNKQDLEQKDPSVSSLQGRMSMISGGIVVFL